jgi:hypothetical protein
MGLLAGHLATAQTAPTAPSAPMASAAATPPMGWNSWDSFGLTITEDQFRANVAVLARQLKPFGYNTAVIDEGWFFVNPEDRPKPDTLHYAIDANGRYVPVPGRFPSVGHPPAARAGASDAAPKLAATIQPTSFKALADWVHSQGLKFGIHIVRGIPRASVERNLAIAGSAFRASDAADQTDACPWDPTNWGVKDSAAGQAWYDSLITQYAGWGVDYLKVDCIAAHPYKATEIRMIRRAIDKVGRPMVLSLSPGPTPIESAGEVASLGNMWRISDDFWDFWTSPDPAKAFPQSVLGQFEKTAAWAQYSRPGNWPDADMLPLGHLGPVPGYGKPRETRLTPDEQQTLMTLWSMARSPLVLGANLTQLDPPTLKLLTNRDVLAVDQLATRSGQVLRSGPVIAWLADLPANFPGGYTTALAIFNIADQLITISTSFEAYNLEPTTYRVRDAWAQKDLGPKPSVENLSLPPHASVLWLLKK